MSGNPSLGSSNLKCIYRQTFVLSRSCFIFTNISQTIKCWFEPKTGFFKLFWYMDICRWMIWRLKVQFFIIRCPLSVGTPRHNILFQDDGEAVSYVHVIFIQIIYVEDMIYFASLPISCQVFFILEIYNCTFIYWWWCCCCYCNGDKVLV